MLYNYKEYMKHYNIKERTQGTALSNTLIIYKSIEIFVTANFWLAGRLTGKKSYLAIDLYVML